MYDATGVPRKGQRAAPVQKARTLRAKRKRRAARALLEIFLAPGERAQQNEHDDHDQDNHENA
jgi:hypothetical protein